MWKTEGGGAKEKQEKEKHSCAVVELFRKAGFRIYTQ